MDDEILVLADKARNSLGQYCMHVCKARCCRKGHLSLKKQEVAAVTGDQEIELRSQGRIKDLPDGRTLLQLDHKRGPCPSLKASKCTIYRDPNRPKTCHDYPLFVFNRSVIVAPSCLAVQEGLLDDAVDEMRKKGYRII